MEWYSAAALMLGSVVGLMMLGMPVAFAFLLTNLVGMLVFIGNVGLLNQVIANGISIITRFTFSPIPLFVLMGALFFHTGLAIRVFDTLDACFGRLRGRLSYLTVVGGTMFASLTGSSMANTAMLGSTMVPEMNRRGYKPHMSMGPVLGSGGLAMIIPPSNLGVLLGSLALLDIGALLVAGLIPGVILAGLYMLMIFLQVRLDPTAAPNYDVQRASLFKVVWLLGINILPLGLVVFCVVGLIILGIATPAESAAFGVLGVLVLAGLFRQISWRALHKSVESTLKVVGMVFFIVIASATFSQILSYSGATAGIVAAVGGMELTPLAALLIMFAVMIFLGMFMDQVSMLLLTLPIFMPLADAMGFDLIWFGIIILMSLEMSGTTPPFGLLLYVMLGIAPPGTTLFQVIRAAAPFLICDAILVALLIIEPQIALYLPSLMKGGP